jgi:hypothetical protein
VDATFLSSSTSTEQDRVLLLKIQDAGHSGSSGQYSYLEDLAFEYAFLISMLGVQFRPVGSSNNAGGVNYDMYWQELENEEADEEEEYTADEATTGSAKKPATPLQRFSEYWRKRSLRREEKRKERQRSSSKDPKSRHSKLHSRSSSAAAVAAGLKGLTVKRRQTMENVVGEQAEEEETDDPQIVNQGSNEINDTASASALETSPTEGGSTEVLGELQQQKQRQPGTAAAATTRQVGGAMGSKASLRHVLYPHEEESGRVQSTSRVYNFLSKFF